jgi:NAD(P)-dependent dehydrogenase (short-subunit alcohol dehydrogenase family)
LKHKKIRDVPFIEETRMDICLSVIKELESFSPEHPQAVSIRRATAAIYSAVRERRRAERQAAAAAKDEMVTARTATGHSNRIDDETHGLPLATPTAAEEIVGVLQRDRKCYICKDRYREVHWFYHQLCLPCARENWTRRSARTDLTGRRALVTGGRAKIGMHIALRLLRDGAHTTITTRFPHDAARRFAAMPDASGWLHRLRVIGVDLRDVAQVVALADMAAEAGPLDILINNAAQTVRRSPRAYAPLMAAESRPLPAGSLPELVTIGPAFGGSSRPAFPGQTRSGRPALVSPALQAGPAAIDRLEADTAIDAGGLIPDLDPSNSWVQKIEEIDPIELLEVQLCNTIAPFLLVSRLRQSMAASAARRKYIVNVSAMEGQFNREYKSPNHPHTNMAKAALNMLTRTSAQEMLESDGILMTSVDTGWITDERPHPQKVRLAEEGFHAPLDLVDGAARVYDPIVRGEQGEDLFGCFLKDYARTAW